MRRDELRDRLRALVRARRGSTLIESMIAVVVLVILAVGGSFAARTPAATGVADRSRAVTIVRGQAARLRALPAAALAARDGTAFDADLPGLAILPNAEGRVRVEPWGDAAFGLQHVTLELTWQRRAGLPQRVAVATLRRTGGAP